MADKPKFPPNVATGKNTLTKTGDAIAPQITCPAAELPPGVATQIIPGSPLETQLNYLKARGWRVVGDDGFGHFLFEDPLASNHKIFEYPVKDAKGNQVKDENGEPKVFRTPNEHKVAVVLLNADGNPTPIKQWHCPAPAWKYDLRNALRTQLARDEAGETPEGVIARKERELAEMKAALAKEKERIKAAG